MFPGWLLQKGASDGACELWQQMLCQAPGTESALGGEKGLIENTAPGHLFVQHEAFFSHHHPPAHAWPWMGSCNMSKSSLPSGTIGSACPVLLSWDSTLCTSSSAETSQTTCEWLPQCHKHPHLAHVPQCHKNSDLAHVPQCYRYLAWLGVSQASKASFHTNSASNPVRCKDSCGVPQLL